MEEYAIEYIGYPAIEIVDKPVLTDNLVIERIEDGLAYEYGFVASHKDDIIARWRAYGVLTEMGDISSIADALWYKVSLARAMISIELPLKVPNQTLSVGDTFLEFPAISEIVSRTLLSR